MNNFYLKKSKLYLIALALLVNVSAFSQTWKTLGPVESENISMSGEYTNVATHTDGSIYMSYRDAANSNKISVKKYSNSNLSTVGTAGFSENGAYYTDIAVDKNGVPYVAYMDAVSNKATVKKFSSNAWTTVGTIGFSASSAGYLTIATSPVDGTPYVAYQDGALLGKATVKKYNGSSWVDVGAAGFSSGAANAISLTIASDGTPYVAYQDESIDLKAIAKKFDGSSWVSVGATGVVSTAYAEGLDIAVSSTGIPFVSYTDASGYVTVKKYSAAIWSSMTTLGNYSGTNTNLVVGSDGNPFLNFTVANYGYIYTYKYLGSGTSWSSYSTMYYSSVTHSDLALASDGYPAITFTSSSKPYLFKYSSSGSYTELKSTSLTSIAGSQYANFNTLATSADGSLYVSYFDSYNGYINVKKFGNDTWTSVGSSIYSSYSSSAYADLAINSSNVPYIAYSTGSPNVKRFISGSWINVGTLSGSIYSGAVQIEIDPNGTPYILYNSGSSALTVKKFLGGIWQDVGTAGAISDAPYNFIPKLKIASDGTPHVAYVEGSAGKAVLKKFDGSSWVSVGAPNISTAPYSNYPNIDLAFDGGSIPYIVFNENSNYYVRKYTNSVWSTVASSSTLITPNTSNAVRLAIGTNSTPYLAYIDFSTGKLAAKKVTTSTFTDLGGVSAVSSSTITFPAITTDASGNVFTAYTTSANGNFAKTYGTFGTLPVNLINFSAKPIADANVGLSWTTASEQGNSYFQVERSSDGEKFSQIAKINSTGDNSKYSFVDNAAGAGYNYYRLSQVDNDGKTTSLGIREVKVGLKSAVDAIYPNPLTTNTFTIELGSSAKQLERVQVIDQSGRIIAERFVKPEGNVLNVVLPNKPAAGNYFVKVDGRPALKLLVL